MATLKRHTGSAFEYVGMPVNVGMSPQTLAYAENTALSQAVTATTDLTGLSVTVTVPAGRRIRIRGFSLVSASVADAQVSMAVHQDGAQVGFTRMIARTSGVNLGLDVEAIISPSAGMHTYKLLGQASSSTTFAGAATVQAFILVEDITGSTLPYQPASVPVGQLAYAETTTSQGSITSDVVLTGLSVNVAVPAGRVLKITGHVPFANTNAGSRNILRIRQDGSQIQQKEVSSSVANQSQFMTAEVVVSPSAGAHVYSLSALTTAGTTTMGASAGNSAFILVEDITPTPAPSSGAPGSTLGYAALTTSQTGITTETDVNDLSVTVTVPAGRRLKISSGMGLQSTVAGDYAFMRLTEDGNNISYSQIITGASVQNTDSVAVVTPSAGSHTYKARAARTGSAAGTISVVAATTNPAYLLVEDITGSVWPTGSEVTAGMIASEPWTDWVPVVVQTATLGLTITHARYTKVGRTVTANYRIMVASGTGTAGVSATVSLPVPAASSANVVIGNGWIYDASATRMYSVVVSQFNTTMMNFASDETGSSAWGATPSIALTTSDQINASITYEAAS